MKNVVHKEQETKKQRFKLPEDIDYLRLAEKLLPDLLEPPVKGRTHNTQTTQHPS